LEVDVPGRFESLSMSDGAQIEVYRVSPLGDRRGGLVLVQEIFGLTPHIQEQCELFAGLGYEVLAPALFDREAPGLRLTYESDDVARGVKIARDQHAFATSVADVQTSIDDLKPRGPVFLVGYCYGASVCWAAACRTDGIAATSCYYGSHIARMAAERPRGPTILHFGDRDESIPQEEIALLRTNHPDLGIYVYNAGHGFNSDRRNDYHAPSAELARERTLNLFHVHG
jgi:carboxymethylenebutenolidase